LSIPIVYRATNHKKREGTHLELLVKYDFNEPYLVLRVVSDQGTVEVGLQYQNLSSHLHDPETDEENITVRIK